MTDKKLRGLLWVDHHEARLVHPLAPASGYEAIVVAGDSDRPHERKHDGGHRHPLSVKFADRIAEAVRDYGDLVLTGPGNAKNELMVQLRERHHETAERISIVATRDRGTDAQLVAEARRLFDRLDHMRGIHVPQAHN